MDNPIQQELLNSQYKVSAVPFHTHNGIDAPPISPVLIVNSSYALTYATTIYLPSIKYILYTATTNSTVGNSTIIAPTLGKAGQVIYILITNDATAARTITFGTGFNSTGTLTGTVSKSAIVGFISDGTVFWEFSRTVGLG